MLLSDRIIKFSSHTFKSVHIIVLLNQLLCTSSLTIMKLNQINQNITILQQKENNRMNNDFRSIYENSFATESNNERKRNKRWANLFLRMQVYSGLSYKKDICNIFQKYCLEQP